MSQQQLDDVDPKSFGLFLDLAGMRLGFRSKGKFRLLDIRDTDLDTNDLIVFENVVTAQGWSVSDRDVKNRERNCISPETMKKAICKIRKVLGDDASAPRFIGTDSKRPRVGAEGPSYYVVRGVRVCLIRKAQ